MAQKKKIIEGTVLDKGKSERPQLSKGNIEHVRQDFANSSKPNTTMYGSTAAKQLPRSAVFHARNKRLQLYTYKVQLLKTV